jgi:hypothetical protein
MWRAAQHSHSENTHWLLLLSIEWVNWPLFISQPVVPIALYFYEWQQTVLTVIFATVLWRLAIAPRFISVLLADLGPLFIQLKFLTCPIMAFLIWKQGDWTRAVLALLWPVVVLLIQLLSNACGMIATALVRRNVLRAELNGIRERFNQAIGFSSSSFKTYDAYIAYCQTVGERPSAQGYDKWATDWERKETR